MGGPSAARTAALDDGYSGRVGMAQDLVKGAVELPGLMTAGRWKRSKLPARYTEGQAAGRGAVARYYGWVNVKRRYGQTWVRV